MGPLALAVREGVQPLHDALLEQVGRVGVVIGARGIHKHVPLAGVAVHVGIGSMSE